MFERASNQLATNWARTAAKQGRQMTVAALKLLVNIRSWRLAAMPVFVTLRRHGTFCLDQLVIELGRAG
jgi:hypothetical protein